MKWWRQQDAVSRGNEGRFSSLKARVVWREGDGHADLWSGQVEIHVDNTATEDEIDVSEKTSKKNSKEY